MKSFKNSFANVTSSFNLLVNNGPTNIRVCLVIPVLADVANGPAIAPAFISRESNEGADALNQSIKTSTFLSPFSTSAANPDPVQITNFNMQVSGKNLLFFHQFQYNCESFVKQLVSSNQLNGS